MTLPPSPSSGTVNPAPVVHFRKDTFSVRRFDADPGIFPGTVKRLTVTEAEWAANPVGAIGRLKPRDLGFGAFTDGCRQTPV